MLAVMERSRVCSSLLSAHMLKRTQGWPRQLTGPVTDAMSGARDGLHLLSSHIQGHRDPTAPAFFFFFFTFPSQAASQTGPLSKPGPPSPLPNFFLTWLLNKNDLTLNLRRPNDCQLQFLSFLAHYV